MTIENFIWGSTFLLWLIVVKRGATKITNGAANQACAHYSSEWRARYRCDARAQRCATDRGLLRSAKVVASGTQAHRGKYQNHSRSHFIPLRYQYAQSVRASVCIGNL
jgi:hypothetical protein